MVNRYKRNLQSRGGLYESHLTLTTTATPAQGKNYREHIITRRSLPADGTGRSGGDDTSSEFTYLPIIGHSNTRIDIGQDELPVLFLLLHSIESQWFVIIRFPMQVTVTVTR